MVPGTIVPHTLRHLERSRELSFVDTKSSETLLLIIAFSVPLREILSLKPSFA